MNEDVSLRDDVMACKGKGKLEKNINFKALFWLRIIILAS